jgi:hypothetical protein
MQRAHCSAIAALAVLLIAAPLFALTQQELKNPQLFTNPDSRRRDWRM